MQARNMTSSPDISEISLKSVRCLWKAGSECSLCTDTAWTTVACWHRWMSIY